MTKNTWFFGSYRGPSVFLDFMKSPMKARDDMGIPSRQLIRDAGGFINIHLVLMAVSPSNLRTKDLLRG